MEVKWAKTSIKRTILKDICCAECIVEVLGISLFQYWERFHVDRYNTNNENRDAELARRYRVFI